MKYLSTLLIAVLMFFSANAEIDPDHRTAAPGIMVLPSLDISMYVQRYHVFFTPREGNIYYRWMNNSDGRWTDWSESGKVVAFDKPATYTLEAYAKKTGKLESAHLMTTFTVAYAGMNVAPGIRLQLADERGYYVTFTSFFDYDIYYHWKAGDEDFSKWLLYQEPIPFTEIGKYTIEGQCDYDYVSVTFEVDRSTPGGHEFLPGDVNLDGVIDVDDITVLLSFILGNSPDTFDEGLADINGDYLIDIADVTALISRVLNGK